MGPIVISCKKKGLHGTIETSSPWSSLWDF